MISHPVLVAAVLLTLFGVAGSALVAFTHERTAPLIEENERAALLRKLHALVPAERIDNDIIADRIVVHRKELLGADATTVYRARLKGEPVAAVFTPVVPDGYSGPIYLLVAVREDGTLDGVRVISHKETPGLGDKIEEEKSDWIHGFEGKSLGNPPMQDWQVKRDGGAFDQFTGATITPRAVVRAVRNTLIYFREERDRLFEQRSITAKAPEKETR
jgi:electron transport complex protein RnfG